MFIGDVIMAHDTGSIEIGARLRELRIKSGKTQEEVGKLIGKSDAMIGHYERGYKMPNPEILKKFAEIFSVSVGRILGSEDDDAYDIFEDELPKELKDLKIGYIRAAKKAQDLKLSPEDLEKLIEIAENMKKR